MVPNPKPVEKTAHTPGPWQIKPFPETDRCIPSVVHETTSGHVEVCCCYSGSVGSFDECNANASLIAAAPDMDREMRRFLPVIEAAEREPAIWNTLTAGLGIATANGYRAAIAKAGGGA